MAPRRARRRPSGVNRNYLNQRQKLSMQRNPLLQGPRQAPVQGPALRIPGGLMGTRQPVPTSRPAPIPDVFELGRRANLKPAPAPQPQARDILGLLMGLPRALTIPGIVANVFRPTALGDGTLEGALRRGESIEQDANLKPAKPVKEPTPQKAKLSAAAKDFDRAFAKARAEGKDVFTWRGRRYTTELA